jgi:hypothetical protein
MTWDDYCAEYIEALDTLKLNNRASRGKFNEVVTQLKRVIKKKLASRILREDIEWLIQALNDERRKWFVVFVLNTAGNTPKSLFAPMIRAAIYELNPSANRAFIEPCLHTFGHRKVYEALLDYLKSGSNFEKAGAARAVYWAGGGLKSQAAYDALSDIRLQKRRLFLQEFVINDDLNVRRSLIPSLVLDPSQYPEEIKPLVNQAIEIARSHSDDYIRHRVEIQLGTAGLFKPIPPRE